MFTLDQDFLQEMTSHIGKQYKDSAKRVCTVVDVRYTFNSKGALERVRFVSKHEFMGQEVFDYDVTLTTILRRAV